MKLRVLVLLLALANLVFFGWTLGWLDNLVGVRSIGDREPERLTRQVYPESLRILPAETASAAMLAATAPTASTASVESATAPALAALTTTPLVSAPGLACLEAGPFTQVEVEAAEKSLLSGVPPTAWVRRRIESPSRWIIYIGKFADREAMQKKVSQLWRSKIATEELQAPAELLPGLSLGGFDSRAAADAALVKLTKRGVRSAEVVALTQPATLYALRVERADTTLVEQLATLQTVSLSQRFVACERSKDAR